MEKYKKLISKAQEPLTDKEYLEKYVTDMHYFRSSEICLVKDMNSIFLGITPVCARIHGFKNANQGTGRSNYDIQCRVVEFADILSKQDRLAEQTKSAQHILDIHEYHTGFSILKTNKYPIINPATNNILGTFCHAHELVPDCGLKIILDLHGHKFGKCHSMDILLNSGKFELTKIEQHVLFCVCLGVSNRKDVANFLSIVYKKIINAETTVHDAFRRLYRKLNCNTPMQLLEFAVYNDLHLQIPQAFLPTGSYIMR